MTNYKVRPLSGHLAVYKMTQLTTMLSGTHRVTGLFLALVVYFSMLINKFLVLNLSSYWVYWVAYYLNFYSNIFMYIFAFGTLFSVYYHLLNGIRHLGWDICLGIELDELYFTGKIVAVSSVIVTIISMYFLI